MNDAGGFRPDDEAQQILAAIVESSDDAIVGEDLAGTILTWNRGAERMYGFGASEMIGRTAASLLPPDHADELGANLARVRRGERIDPHDTVRLTRSGHRIEVSLTISPIRDVGGQLVGAASVARDITAQRRAERALRTSEARWRAIIEAAVDGVIVIDARGRIESFNPAAERLFGYRAEEVAGQNVSMLMPDQFATQHDSYLERYMTTGERHIIGIGREVTGRRRDGTTIPLHLSVGEMQLDGATKFTGIVRDLSDRVRLEARLREESGLVRIGELAAVLAHEVKNPLAAVGGAVQMLIDRLAPADQEIAHEILARLDGLNALMGDLLLYARPPRPRMTRIDVAGLLEGLVQFLKSDPSWQDLVVTVDVGPQSLVADPELLRIAFQNLLLNAAQATNGRGRVGVSLRAPDRESIEVDVSDDGPGIPVEIRDQLFTPFVTTKSRGTGLGLATVRRIAEAHGGGVRVLATGPDGTTIRVRLALHPPGAQNWRDS